MIYPASTPRIQTAPPAGFSIDARSFPVSPAPAAILSYWPKVSQTSSAGARAVQSTSGTQGASYEMQVAKTFRTHKFKLMGLLVDWHFLGHRAGWPNTTRQVTQAPQLRTTKSARCAIQIQTLSDGNRRKHSHRGTSRPRVPFDPMLAARCLSALCVIHAAMGVAAGRTFESPSPNSAGSELGVASAIEAPSLPGQPILPGAGALQENRNVSWKLIATNVLHDQKNIWLFPTTVAKGQHWKPAVGFVATTAGLLALDPPEASYFRTTSSFHSFNRAFSGTHTAIGMAALPASFYAVSLVRHNLYDQHTTMLATEAVLDSELLATLIKDTSRRLRPGQVPAGAGFSDTFGDAKGGLFSSASFPSGHTIAAFSLATVFANRYSRHRWVPWVAYGLAASVAFSRLSLQAHFTSDVFAGAVLGYSISHYVVLPH